MSRDTIGLQTTEEAALLNFMKNMTKALRKPCSDLPGLCGFARNLWKKRKPMDFSHQVYLVLLRLLACWTLISVYCFVGSPKIP